MTRERALKLSLAILHEQRHQAKAEENHSRHDELVEIIDEIEIVYREEKGPA